MGRQELWVQLLFIAGVAFGLGALCLAFVERMVMAEYLTCTECIHSRKGRCTIKNRAAGKRSRACRYYEEK